MEITNAHIFQLLASAAIFLFAWKYIGEGYIKQFLDLLIERDEKTVGDEQKARETHVRSERVEADIEAELNEARVEGISLKESQVEKAKQEADKIISQARETADREISAGREEIAKLAKSVEAELSVQAEELAGSIIEKVKQSSASAQTH